MEKGNQENMKKKNMSIKIVTGGGGGLAGIILLGGALATAALVTKFAFKRKQQSKKSKVVKDDDELLVGEGLSLSSQFNHHHHPSNGTQNEPVSGQIGILDETSQIIDGKDKEVDVPELARQSLLCDESCTSKEEFLVPVADSSLLLTPEEMNKYDPLQENAVLKVDEEIMTADSNQIGVVDNDRHIPLEEDEVCDGIGVNSDGNNKQLVEATLADQVGVDGKEHMLAEECNENKEVIIERKEVLAEAAQSEQLGVDDDYHKFGDECNGNGHILVEKREEPYEAAVVDQIRVNDNPYKGGEECDDVGITTEKGEVLAGEVVANGIQLREKLEGTTMYGDQDILCSDGIIINRNDTESCDPKKADLLLPVIDISSLLKPSKNDHVEDPLVIEDMKILGGDVANEAAVQEVLIKVEGRAQIQLVEADGTNDKCEEADEIAVVNDNQMLPFEEYQMNLINEDKEKYSKSIEINSFQSNSFDVQEFSFPLLDSPALFKYGNLNKNDSSETALHAKDANPMEKDRSPDEVFTYQIMLESKPLVQLAENDEMKSCDDGSESDVAEGEKTLEAGLVDIAQQTELSEQYNFNDGNKNDKEAFEIIQTEDFELDNNQQSPLKEANYYDDNVNRKDDSDCAEQDEEENSDCDEEDTVDEVEESSETTGDSSLDSNAEAIWPAESVQELSQKVKDIQANNHNFKETEREDNFVKFNRYKLEEEDRDSFEMGFSNKLTAEITTLRQPTNFSNLKFWFLSLLVPFLLLLLLWLFSSQISFLRSSHCHLQ